MKIKGHKSTLCVILFALQHDYTKDLTALNLQASGEALRGNLNLCSLGFGRRLDCEPEG